VPGQFQTGDVLVAKFRIVRIVGEGGMGVVYEAEHLSLSERVALKVLHSDQEPGDRRAQRLLREARAAARIKSEHVARVNDFGTLPDGSPFLVMELVEGESLSRVLRERGPLPVEVAVQYALQICIALAEAHALGIVHRDIKPSNLIVAERRDGSELVKVLDFGVAKQVKADAPTMTASSGVLGSPSYMSPEQIRDAHSVDERSDIWSLGVVIYEMLTARLPFEAFTAPGVLAAITADEAVPPSKYRSELGDSLERIVLSCLAKQREQRYPRVVELAQALADHAASGSELAARVQRLRESTHERRAVPEPAAEPSGEASLTQNATATTAAESLKAPFAHEKRGRPLIAIGAVVALAAALATLALIQRSSPDSAPAAIPSPATLASPSAPPASAIQVVPVAPQTEIAPPAASTATPAEPHPKPARALRKPPVTELTASASAPPAPAPQPTTSATAPLDFGYRK
jgi:serine/threonine-protein kinase